MAHVITAPCLGVKDGACADVCCVEAFHTTPDADQFYIDPDVCMDCGACVAACPVGAIFYTGDVPEPWQGFIELNASKSRARDESSLGGGEGGGRCKT